MQNSKTILIVTGIFPPDIGGPATYVPKIATHLAGQGHKVTVITFSDIEDRTEAHYLFRLIRIKRSMFKPLRWIFTILRILQFGYRADMLYVNGLQLESAQANLLMRKPMVMKVVGDVAWERSVGKGWSEESFERFQLTKHNNILVMLQINFRTWWTKQAHKIITPSNYLAKTIAAWGVPIQRLNVIRNAVHIPTNIDDTHIALRKNCKTILVTVGRLIPLKQVDKLLDALVTLEHMGLVVVGEGAERSRLEAKARDLEIIERVSFFGSKNHEETLAIINACDILVLYSTHEGLPHVVIEAMMLGKRIVASSVGGTPELLEGYAPGRLVSPDDTSQLLEAILELSMLPAQTNGSVSLSDYEEATMLKKTTDVLLETLRASESV
jgi:glycosyltransferase involved in cell wall biosynthesis